MIKPSLDQLLLGYQRKVLKALTHLEYSINKVGGLTHDPTAMDEETLAAWESFTTRFSRVVDLFLTKYCRTYVLIQDPGFEGSVRDYANAAEKYGLIESADRWMTLRGFRNLVSHEYEETDLALIFSEMRSCAGEILKIKGRI
jgi:hypothetical protein